MQTALKTAASASPARQSQYEQQVYAGVLGKVIGVYMGRPIENWRKGNIQKVHGSIDRYIHAERNPKNPLVVADDDITGTFTFVRALEDSGLAGDTPCEFFGDTWLNYIIEGKSILWWGGMAVSTEHTAFLRLQDGIKAPESGSMALNGKIVSEQIGAQIFIDAIGMCCPGDPLKAAELARRAARVSHDGEAVHAAVVVASMCAHAFVESDMEALLDGAMEQIPEDSLIARIHREVRAWVREDGDWEKTFERIDERYGYHKYGGNCHVVPNHAIMVMAWAYAGDDFLEAQRIINTAGWDTDCNAANVGSVMGIALGLDGIEKRYPFRPPFADRLLMPTADGSRGVTDCLIEARAIAAIGRSVMGWPAIPAARTWQHFSEPGSLQGWLPEEEDFNQRGTAQVDNVPHPSGQGRCLRIGAQIAVGRPAVISCPILRSTASGYCVDGSPRLWPGSTVTFSLIGTGGQARLRPFLRYRADGEEESSIHVFAAVNPRPGELSIEIPLDLGGMVEDLGLRLEADDQQSAELLIDSIDFSGRAVIDLPQGPRPVGGGGSFTVPGWLHDCDKIRGPFTDSPENTGYIGKNRGRALCCTGGRDWSDTTIRSEIGLHGGNACGLVIRYQGRERYYALRQTGDMLQLIKRHYGKDIVLAECQQELLSDLAIAYEFHATGNKLNIQRDGKTLLSAEDDNFSCGGAGLLVEQGLAIVRHLHIEAELSPQRF